MSKNQENNEKLENQNISEENTTEKISTPAKDLLNEVVANQKKPDEDSDKKEKVKKPHKKLKHSVMSIILTVVFVAVIVLVNVVATALFEKYPITVDLTNDKVYSISEESEKYVKDIDTDVLITVFATEEAFSNIAYLNTFSKQALEVMKKYSQYNDKISYRFVDIDSNPDVVAEYSSDSISQFDIIVETNPTSDVKRTRKITMTDLVEVPDDYMEYLAQYGISNIKTASEQAGGAINLLQSMIYTGYSIESSTADQAFVSAFMAVTDPNPVNVTILTGRNEASTLTYLQSLLEANGYIVNTVDITKEEIPEDTSVAVMPAPATDYLDTEIKKVDEYLNNNGDLGKQLVYAGSITQGKTPNIDEFLAEYGIEIGEGIVCEENSNYYYQYPYYAFTNDISDTFTQDLDIKNSVFLNYASRPVNILFDEKGQIKTVAYIKSTESAYVADATTSALEKIGKGQQNYAVVSSKAAFLDDGGANYSNVIVFGAVESLSDQALSYSQFQNREYVLSLLNGITHKTDGITITPKVIKANVFDITSKQKSVLNWTFIGIIPVVTLIIGGVVWLRRKNR